MIFKIESGRVSKEIPGIGSGSGTRWALHVIEKQLLRVIYLQDLSGFQRFVCVVRGPVLSFIPFYHNSSVMSVSTCHLSLLAFMNKPLVDN